MDKLKLKNETFTVINVLLIFFIGIIGLVFLSLYLDLIQFDSLYKYKLIIQVISFALLTCITIITLIFYLLGHDFIYKLCYILIVLTLITSIILYFLEKNGILSKIKSINDIRNYVSSFGSWAVIVFIIIQFLQVIILPIPGMLTVGAGVLLFGPWLGALYSFIGILLGSFVAFFIGRYLGYRVASWLVGEKTLKKTMQSVKGKDKVILTFMFLFPFFPDDVLCFIAGLSTMSNKYFFIMITTTRVISILISSFSLNGNIIPYNTWWGLIIWAIFIALIIYVTYYIYNYGDLIEKYIVKKFKRKR